MHDPRHCALQRPAELSSHHSLYEDDALMLGLADLLAKNIAGDLGAGSLPSARPIRAPPRSGAHAGALMLPRPGLVIDGKRQLTRLIGAGSFGSVFEARQLDLDRLEAIKFLHERWMADAYLDVRTRFMEEARVMAKMRSPHLAEIYDWGTLPGGLPFFVMERLEGKTLRARLRERAELSLPELFDVAAELLEGLAHAHAHGVVHRDVKPENIFLTARGVKLIDFGLAGSSTQPASGEGAMGTPLYMAPELLAGSACPDARTDVYGASVVMYEMLSGSVPFQWPGLDPRGLTQAPTCERPLPLDTHRAGAPPGLDALIQSGLAKQAHERPQSAYAMLEQLLEIRKRWASTASNPHKGETSCTPTIYCSSNAGA
jgi:eukaryotic-like serine/threonine-protein kinase